jgi:hypothetical protein
LKRLEKTIHGWLPQEPSLVKLQRAARPKVFVSRNNLGLKLVAVLFWVFGLAGIFTALLFFQFGYLSVSFRFFAFAVSLADSLGMLIVGTGLLTAKSRWINTVIVFSFISTALFYLIPLRPAFPLEILVVAYLLYMRKGFPAKQVITKFPAVAMVVVVCIALFMPIGFVNAQASEPSKTEVASFSQTSDAGNLKANVIVFQYADGDKEKDYYQIYVNVFNIERNLNCINANLSVSSQSTITITFNHLPQANPVYPLALGLGIPTFHVGNLQTVFVYTSPTSVDWVEKSTIEKHGEVFSVELFVPQNAHFNVRLWTQAGFQDEIFGNLWSDQLTTEAIEA